MANSPAPSFIKPAATPDDDKLAAIRAEASRARDLELEIASVEERLAELNAALTALQSQTLPDMMEALGIDRLGLNAEGNLPAYDVKLQPFYSAGISAKWPPDQRAAAFEYLESLGEGDLIKANIAVPFPREQHADARALADRLAAEGLVVHFDESVHQATLTSWLKKQVEDKHFIPDLDKIGGRIGKVVRLKERKS